MKLHHSSSTTTTVVQDEGLSQQQQSQALSPPTPPQAFICPITMEIMTHPLVTRSGLNFERSAILEWLDQHDETCPLTRSPMRLSDLIPNVQLQQRIRCWKDLHGYNNTDNDNNDDDDDEIAGTFWKGHVPSSFLVIRMDQQQPPHGEEHRQAALLDEEFPTSRAVQSWRSSPSSKPQQQQRKPPNLLRRTLARATRRSRPHN